jgi:hypothetical protein
MSGTNENDPLKNNQGGQGGNKPPEKKLGNPTIEEHAKNLKVDAPVFAAVMQSKNWASGKRVPVADFEKAVKDFLGASMGGA